VAAVELGVYTSTNALNWKQLEGLQNYSLGAVAYFDGEFWVAGAESVHGNYTGAILRSADTEVWSSVEGLNLPSISQILGLSLAGDSLLASGTTRIILQSACIDRRTERHLEEAGTDAGSAGGGA
jgi:hypothetical protein